MNQLRRIPFVFISSQLAENCDTVYGTLKRLGEHWAKLNGGVAVRLWNVYGAYEDSTVKSHVVADFIHQALNTNKIIMQTDGQEKRQFIYIEDVCDALHESFNHKGVFDITTLKWDSIYGMASLISTHTGCELVVGHKKGTTLEVPHKPLVPQWNSKINLSEGLKKTIKLFRDKK
jgi:nucleoside-diphosphate-sugar epimerase